ncbi:TetR/AcrR family transcriptional regulator [Halosimplex litoreum]|uniref:TetR/AcrR family transcriptional regulator n=1 Tax=Halosimplex litoreum TaxID=1198301 RepID=A0A7U3WB20_9EURY|nr:TetR/AcrR family transcriptional regulator [Halosimplex litoreum]QPV64815.1 TetR/AcrR family transcriptional regulator [Halosimplex litoreum]
MTDDAADASATTEGDPPGDSEGDQPDDEPAETAADGGDGPSTEDEIRWAAIDVLVEHGFDEFTTQAVADAAGVSQSLVHYYFETKADLVRSMFERGLDVTTAQVESAVDDDDPRERLVGLARYLLRGEGVDEPVQFNRMVLGLQSRAPYDEDLRDVVAYNHSFLREYVVEAVEEGIDSGRFREVDPEVFAAAYVAAMRSANDWRAIFGDEGDWDLVLAGLEAIVDDYLVREDHE